MHLVSVCKMPAQHDGNDVSSINIGLQSDRSKHLNIKKKKDMEVLLFS